MQLLLIVLNRVEKLDDLLDGLLKHGISGATIISSTGLMKELAKNIEDYPAFGTLRYLIDFGREENKTIFIVLEEEQIETAKRVVREVIGDLFKPDTAIMFTLPVLSAEGIGF